MEENSRELSERRERIERLELQLSESKRKYAAALSALESISREIHERRGDLDAAIAQAQQEAAEREAEAVRRRPLGADAEVAAIAIGSISGAISSSAVVAEPPAAEPLSQSKTAISAAQNSSGSTVVPVSKLKPDEVPVQQQRQNEPSAAPSDAVPEKRVHWDRKLSQPVVAPPVAAYPSATLPEGAAARAVAAHRMSIQQQAMQQQPLGFGLLDPSQMLGSQALALPALDLLRQNVIEYPSEYVPVKRRLGIEKHYYRHFFSRPCSLPGGAPGDSKSEPKKKPRTTTTTSTAPKAADATDSASRPKSSSEFSSGSGLLVLSTSASTPSQKASNATASASGTSVSSKTKSSPATSNTSANGNGAAPVFSKPVRLTDQPSDLYRVLVAREPETESTASARTPDAVTNSPLKQNSSASTSGVENESRERSETLTSNASLAGSSEATTSSTSMTSGSDRSTSASASASAASCCSSEQTVNEHLTPTQESAQESASSTDASPAHSTEGSVRLRAKTGHALLNSHTNDDNESASADSNCASERSSTAGDALSPMSTNVPESLVRRSELMGEEIDKLKNRLSMLQLSTENGGGAAAAAGALASDCQNSELLSTNL